MKRSKTIGFSLGLFLFIIIIMIATFASQKEDGPDTAMESQEELQETEWQVEEDDETAAGSNLFYGSSMAEGNTSLYILDTGRYDGRPADENEHGYIYQKKEGEWGVFVDDAPFGMYDINEISNLVYMDGYIYFALKEVDVGVGRTVEESYIYRVPEEEGYKRLSGVGTLEWISPCDVNFYVYNGEIYFKYHDYRRNGRRCFYKVSLNGEDEEELYSDDQEDTSESDYTVGGGCLYLKDEEQILGINLETGERKGFETDAEHIDGLFYEHGGLYIYDSANGQVYQMDVRTGSESKLIEGKILSDCVWVHDGWLYYVEGGKEQKAFCCDLKAVNLTTKEILLWKSVPFDRQPCDAGLEVVEGRIMVDFCVINENGTKEYTYLEKEVSEITDAEYKESIELTDKEKEEGQIKTIVIQDGFREGKWQVTEDGDEAILGDNLSSTSSAKGNG